MLSILHCTCFTACCDFLSPPFTCAFQNHVISPTLALTMIFFHSFPNNVGWMEWIFCLVLSYLVYLSRLSFLMLMWMSLEWGMWGGWVCDFVCAGCLFVLGAISHTLCVYNGIRIFHVFLLHLLYIQLFVYCEMKTNKLKLILNWIGK